MRPNVVAPVIRSATGRSCCEAEVIVLAAIPSLFHPADAHRIRSSPRLERAGGIIGVGCWYRSVVACCRSRQPLLRKGPTTTAASREDRRGVSVWVPRIRSRRGLVLVDESAE